MASQHTDVLSDVDPRQRRTALTSLVAQADLVAKAALVVMVLLVLNDPAWGNLEGKAPFARAVTYPLLALVVPALWVARGRSKPYPWLADLMVTIPGFSDFLGNRLDLYDQVVWFDDWMHFANIVLFSAALLMLFGTAGARPVDLLARATAFGLAVSILWEWWEYAAFITQSDEMPTAYVDTLLDISLGGLGAIVGALLVIAIRRTGSRRTN